MTHTLETTGIARVVARALQSERGPHRGDRPRARHGPSAVRARRRGGARRGLALERGGGGFRHNEQSAAIARRLNLTHEVVDGIRTHRASGEPETLEGKIVRVVDRVAYINHDIDDAIRYGILEEADLPREEIDVLGADGCAPHRPARPRSRRDARPHAGDIVQSDEVGGAMLSLRSFMFERVYLGPDTLAEHVRARGQPIRAIYEHLSAQGEPEHEIVEFIAGMTDRFALSYVERL